MLFLSFSQSFSFLFDVSCLISIPLTSISPFPITTLVVFFWPIAGGGTWYEYNNILNKFCNDNVVASKTLEPRIVPLGGSFLICYFLLFVWRLCGLELDNTWRTCESNVSIIFENFCSIFFVVLSTCFFLRATTKKTHASICIRSHVSVLFLYTHTCIRNYLIAAAN